MILKKESTKNERLAIKWFQENKFDIVDVKQYVSKTKFKLIKNGESAEFELPYEITNLNKWLEHFNRDFETKLEIKKLKQQLGK